MNDDLIFDEVIWLDASLVRPTSDYLDYRLRASIQRVGLMEPIIVGYSCNQFQIISGNKKIFTT